MASKITYEQVIAYADGLLPEQQCSAVAEHIRTSAQDAATLALYRLVKQQVAHDDGALPSATAIARAQGHYAQNHAATAPSWSDAVQRIVARLTFNSRVQTAAVRFLDPEQINLRYEANGAEIDLQGRRENATPDHVAPSKGLWRVVGQITRDDLKAGIALAAYSADRKEICAEVNTDAHGVFTLDLQPGDYELLVRLPEGIVAIQNIQLT